MTEKWIVAAAVEVLLQFPLDPGNDPKCPLCRKGEMLAIGGPASHSFTEIWRPEGGVGQLSRGHVGRAGGSPYRPQVWAIGFCLNIQEASELCVLRHNRLLFVSCHLRICT